MINESNKLNGIKICIPLIALIGLGLSISSSSCWDNNADANIQPEDVAYGNAELIPETTSILGNKKESDKVITNLKAVNGTTLKDNFQFIEEVFRSNNPEFVKAMLFDGGSLKSGLDKDFIFKVNNGTTIFDLYLNNVLGENNENNNRVTNKGLRDEWSKDSGLLTLFSKAMSENVDGLNSTTNAAGKPMLFHYLQRLVEGYWHHAFDELMKSFSKMDKIEGLEEYIPLVYEMSQVPENSVAKTSFDSFFGNDYRERWGGYVLKIINKEENGGCTLSDKDIVHKAYINFIKDDWNQRIEGTSVVSRLTIIFGKNDMTPSIKGLYIAFFPEMIKTKDSKTYASSYDYIIGGLGNEACNAKTIAAAIKSNKPDLVKKLLIQSTEISPIMSSPEYDSCANIIDFYAEKKYFPGKSSYELFLNMVKKRVNDPDKYKNYLKVAQDKCIDERSSKEATKCISDAMLNADKAVDASIP